jgi:phosphatidylserine/phosphatidylglycerophosphate/cardiolipin synthase-like enzyme
MTGEGIQRMNRKTQFSPKSTFRALLGLSLLSLNIPSYGLSNTFPTGTAYSVCFTPQENCTALLINSSKAAKNSIYVQSYSFTSYKIAKALVDAYERGVEVNIILDASNFDPKNFSEESYLKASGLSLWKDDQVHIAHNKVMIFDESTIETGSFNYTTSAQKYNAENMILIKDKTLSETYLKNWAARKALSSKVEQK